ncbi:MAG: hypothetical protein AVO34_04695 [Firmicutes bacterium ML8_F2]|jgi:2,3-diketo-5-methylthio-1-phosphopentane phosphatase|nr:MAG: hypothetical protein AVO34_04695 [Firmicutes bacterium ML8_F2]
MTRSAAYLVDFDGTITTKDLSSELAFFFGGDRYLEVEALYRKRKIGIREWLINIARILPPDPDLLLSKTLEWATIRSGFEQFIAHAREQGSPVVIASDGFGFYIETILEKYGFLDCIDRIYANRTVLGADGLLAVRTPHAHPLCPVCGNCKAIHVLKLKEAGYPVIYIGDGSNDRFGAFWSDHICARDSLANVCREHDIKFSPWVDFYDIIKVDKPAITDRADRSLCCPMGSGIKK